MSPFCFCRWTCKFQNQQPTQLITCMHLWSLLIIYCIVCAQTHPHLLRFTYLCSTHNQKLTVVKSIKYTEITGELDLSESPGIINYIIANVATGCFFPLSVISHNFKITTKILLLLWYIQFLEVDDYAKNIHLIFEVDTPNKTKQKYTPNYNQ